VGTQTAAASADYEPITNQIEFNQKLWEWATTTEEGLAAQSQYKIGFINKRLKYSKIIASTVGSQLDPMHLKLPIFHSWDLVVRQFKSTAPRSMQSISQNANEHWAFMDSENAFTKSAKQGLPIALAFAFVVLLIASRNIIVALAAISSIAITILSVIYVIVTRDWRLGIAESICLIIILGLSIDYTVHLANEFIYSQHRHRKYKMKQAYKNIGVSIFGGAIVTFGAGAFLYGAELMLYQKFAIIICCTVVISFFVSTIFFGALMHILGPMRNCGDVLYFCTEKESPEDEEYRI